MNQLVIFLHYHGIGHINPCLSLANILEQNGCQVYFAGVEFFSQYVTAQGFPFYGLTSVPFGLGFETWLNTVRKKKHVYFSSLRDRVTDVIYAEREKDLVKMLDVLNPDVVLIDATQSTDFIVLYPHLRTRGIKVAVLHAMLPTHVIPGRPPVNSYAFPDDKKGVRSALFKMRISRFKKSFKQKLKYFFFDDQLIIKRRIKKNKIPDHFISHIPSLFNFNVQGQNELVLVPREFDFPDFKVEAFQHYIGFLMHTRKNDPGHEKFGDAWGEIVNKSTTQGLKLIYCSFGTIESDHKRTILSFLEKLIAVVRRLNHILVISIKNQQVLDKFQTDPTGTVYFFSSVPQIEVLRDADLFITHGGLSSIKESIDAEVPMLMYPVHSDYDPKGNTARVVYHGMGLRGNAKRDSEESIENKIQELLTDKKFRINVLKLKQQNRNYSPERFISLFKKLQPLN